MFRLLAPTGDPTKVRHVICLLLSAKFNTAPRVQTNTCKGDLDGTPCAFYLRSSETGSVQWSLHPGYAEPGPARPGGSENVGEGCSARTRVVCEGKTLECEITNCNCVGLSCHWQTAEQGHLWLIFWSRLINIRYWV
jgi:hypothetical protein